MSNTLPISLNAFLLVSIISLSSPIFGVPAAIECGDGVTSNLEACDDGNQDDGDGCSSQCLIEDMTDAFICEDNSDCETGLCCTSCGVCLSPNGDEDLDGVLNSDEVANGTDAFYACDPNVTAGCFCSDNVICDPGLTCENRACVATGSETSDDAEVDQSDEDTQDDAEQTEEQDGGSVDDGEDNPNLPPLDDTLDPSGLRFRAGGDCQSAAGSVLPFLALMLLLRRKQLKA